MYALSQFLSNIYRTHWTDFICWNLYRRESLYNPSISRRESVHSLEIQTRERTLLCDPDERAYTTWRSRREDVHSLEIQTRGRTLLGDPDERVNYLVIMTWERILHGDQDERAYTPWWSRRERLHSFVIQTRGRTLYWVTQTREVTSLETQTRWRKILEDFTKKRTSLELIDEGEYRAVWFRGLIGLHFQNIYLLSPSIAIHLQSLIGNER